MEESVKTHQPFVTSAGKSRLRYPLRSSSKLKDQGNKSPELVNSSSSATSKRGRPPSVSKSVSVLELSAKDKAAKPPRRLSIPAKSSVSPQQRSAGNITPISEARSRRAGNGHDNCDTPLSDVSRSSTRRKFCLLTSLSYWLQQIKLSESAAKHSISLGFFKLALEAGCEPLQRLREELKSYARRHDLAEFGETVRSIFESYEISESLEQLQVSENCSHVPEDATTPSSEDVQSTSSTAGTRKLKPKFLNTDTEALSAKGSSRKDNVQRPAIATKVRTSVNRNPVNPRLVADSGVENVKKKVQRLGKQEPKNGEDKIKKQDEKSVVGKGTTEAVDMDETVEGNKENMDAPLMGEV